MSTLKNTVISRVEPESPEGMEGHTHAVTCRLCGEKVYGDSVRFFATWIKDHRCATPAMKEPPAG